MKQLQRLLFFSLFTHSFQESFSENELISQHCRPFNQRISIPIVHIKAFFPGSSALGTFTASVK